ncbi:MAG: hypothetical protein FJ265_01120 [Planctomycetes bacterium]|nr:hypothetical protein [Planctomycetota bacterium]
MDTTHDRLPLHNGSPARRRLWALALPALLGGCIFISGCATTKEVGLLATPGEPMNPSRNNVSAPVDVYAFFLKKCEAFEGKERRLDDFLTEDVRRENRNWPAFLAADVVDVKKIKVLPQKDGVAEPTVAQVTVPLDVACVGLVGDFQGHRDDDPNEVWRLCLPAPGGSVAFRVDGKRLAVPPPPEKPKEAARAKSPDG